MCDAGTTWTSDQIIQDQTNVVEQCGIFRKTSEVDPIFVNVVTLRVSYRYDLVYKTVISRKHGCRSPLFYIWEFRLLFFGLELFLNNMPRPSRGTKVQYIVDVIGLWECGFNQTRLNTADFSKPMCDRNIKIFLAFWTLLTLNRKLCMIQFLVVPFQYHHLY